MKNEEWESQKHWLGKSFNLLTIVYYDKKEGN
jgi:uncharacterized membrane protein